MIRYLQLPFSFDAHSLAAEVSRITASWCLHFNRRDYEGIWSGLALRTPGGRTDHLLAENLNGNMPFMDTPLMRECPYICEVLTALQCPQTSVRLLKLETGAVVKLHKDPGLNFEQGEARLHIPVQTHDDVEFELDGDRLQLGAGQCWYINASLPHRLANHSPVERIHLVVDCSVNDWMCKMFAREDLPVRSIRDTGDADRLQRLQVIAALRESRDPARNALADRMEAEEKS